MTVLQIIAIVFFVIAFILLAAAITVFFTENIIDVIGFLSGRTERKQIEQIREQNTNISYGTKKVRMSRSNTIDDMLSSGNPVTSERADMQVKSYSSKVLNRNRRAVIDTTTINNSSVAVSDGGTVSLDAINGSDSIADDTKTGILSNNQADESESETELLTEDNTVLLDNDTETMLLDNDMPTDVLYTAGTDLSFNSEDETDVLSDGDGIIEIDNTSFEIIDDQTFINTEEVIS
ncbi:MAG: hypothetical protein NC397_08430 [Clostridium sp.]|nr:hypothetical protein [Clostridium sp.]